MKLKSNEPYWLIKNGLLHTYPSLQEDHETEILIIGTGITGSLIAYQCMQEGWQTTLIDRREIANGSTSATTSMLQYEIDVPLWQLIEQIGVPGAVGSYRACSAAIDQLEQMVRAIHSDCGFARKNSLYFAAWKKDVPNLKREFEARKQHGFPVRWLEADEIAAKWGIEQTHGGILSAQGASLDAFKFAHDMLHDLHQKGAAVFDRTEMTQVEYKRGHVLVHTNREATIKAKKIVYCNGFESVEIIPENFVQLLSTYACVSETLLEKPKMLDQLVVWNTAEPYLYFRMTQEGRLLVGGEDEPFSSGVQRDKKVTAKTRRLAQKMAKYLPNITFIPNHSWAGTFGETQDGLPYIGTHEQFPNSYFVLGFGGNGITFSVIGMEMLSLYLQGKSHPLAPYFAFGR